MGAVDEKALTVKWKGRLRDSQWVRAMACDVKQMANIMINKVEVLEKIFRDWRMIILIELIPNALQRVELLKWQNSRTCDSSINLRAQAYLLQSMGFLGNLGRRDSRDTVEIGWF
jgi:hypothetical protein